MRAQLAAALRFAGCIAFALPLPFPLGAAGAVISVSEGWESSSMASTALGSAAFAFEAMIRVDLRTESGSLAVLTANTLEGAVALNVPPRLAAGGMFVVLESASATSLAQVVIERVFDLADGTTTAKVLAVLGILAFVVYFLGRPGPRLVCRTPVSAIDCGVRITLYSNKIRWKQEVLPTQSHH